MDERPPVNNRLYYFTFNDDIKQGGRYSGLSNTEFRCLFVLQAHSDGYGMVRLPDGGGLSGKSLTKITGLSYKTLQKSLTSLEKGGHIQTTDAGIILKDFIYNQTTRANVKNKDKTTTINKSAEAKARRITSTETMVKYANILNAAFNTDFKLDETGGYFVNAKGEKVEDDVIVSRLIELKRKTESLKI